MVSAHHKFTFDFLILFVFQQLLLAVISLNKGSCSISDMVDQGRKLEVSHLLFAKRLNLNHFRFNS